MATRFNKAKNVELNTSEECRECKGWVKAGYKLFGEMTGFVCRDCYPQYINDYPIKGKRVTLGSDISAEHFPPNIISEDNDSTSLSRFRWQFLSALAVIVATLIYIIGKSFVPLAIILFVMGFVLSKPLFRYQSTSGKNLIVPVWVIASVLLLVMIIAGTKSSAPPQESSRVQFTVTVYKDVNAIVRTNPSTNPSVFADSLGVLTIRKGETLGILEAQGDWYKIKVIVNGKDKVGWIHKDLVVPKATVFNISGNWEGKWEIEGLYNPLAINEADFKLSLNQDGSNLTGTYYERDGRSDITGKIEGDEISFEYRYKDGGGRKYIGTLNNTGTEAKGKFEQENGSGSWRMVRETASKPTETPPEKSSSAPEPTSFTIKIQSSPSGATVKIDKKTRGTAPLSIVLDKGSHGIAVEKEGYKTKWDIIEVDNYGKKEFYFALEKE